MEAMLQFTVTNQTMERTDEFTVVEGSENYLQAQFTCTTPDWDGMIKTAVFIDEDGDIHPSLCADDICEVPPEWLIKQKGYIGLIGSDGTTKITTGAVKVNIKEKGYVSGGEIEEEAQAYFDQLLAAFSEKYLETEAQANLAKRWAVGLEEEPDTMEDNAKYYAEQARNDAVQTQNDRNAVSEMSEHVDAVAMQADADKTEAGKYKEQAATSAANTLLSEQAAKTSETAAQEAQAGAETAEGQAELFAQQAADNSESVEAAKTLIMQMGKEVQEKKESVDESVNSFELLHKQAVADVNNAGQNQTERVEEAGNQAVSDINVAGIAQKNAIDEAAQQALQNIGTGVDNTLTQEGKAADSAATGKAIDELKGDLAVNTTNITKNANDIKTLQEDLSSVGQQADANKEEIANLTSSVNEKFLSSGLGILRTGKLYGTKVWKSAVNNSQTLEKTYDNAGLVCVPSTDTTVGQDDYADIPLFQWVRCTYKRYDDGFAYPIAVEGDGNYSEEGNVDCGSLMRTFYYKEIDNDDYTEVIISDSPNHALGLKPWEQAVRADGTVMPYFINSRYHSVVGTDGKLYSNRGRISRNQCHNNMITNYQKKGTGYWGAGSDIYTLAQIMMFIKYGTKSIRKVMAGVTNHSVQVKASIQSEEANTYFPVTNSQANSILVGTRFSVGYGTFNSSGAINVDRGNGTIHAYADDVVVTAKVPMDDGVNTAIYLDCTAFNTMPITDSNGYTSDIYLTSMHAWSGDTDSVIGHHDGSPVSNTDGKHPCRIQGIEFMLGGYTVASDTVMFFKSDYSKDVYVAPRGVAHSTSDSTIQSTYTLVGNIPANNGLDFWIGDVSHVNGVWYPSTVVSSDQYGMGDRCYAGGQSTSGSREYLQGGHLGCGSHAGLSCLSCWNWLGNAAWHFLSAD